MSAAFRQPLRDSSRERRIWRSAILLAGFFLTIAISLPAFVQGSYVGHLARDAERSPTYLITADADPGLYPEPVAKYSWKLTNLNLAYVDVVTLGVIDTSAPRPPGLPRWPAPGEVFASPALLQLPGGADFLKTYGLLAGTIGEEGLSEPGERFVYVGADAEDMKSEFGFASFGVEPVSPQQADALSYGGTPTGVSSFQQRISAWWVGIAFFILIPSMILMYIALRLGAERRDRRIAVLRTIGASPHQVRGIILREVVPPLILGSFFAMLVAFAATLSTWKIPLLHYFVVGADVRPLSWWFLCASLLAITVTVLISLFSYRAKNTSPFGS